METAIDLLQFFSICIPTFICEPNSFPLRNLDLSATILFRQPVLLLSASDYNEAYNNYSEVILPVRLKFGIPPYTRVPLCSYVFNFDLAKFIDVSYKAAISKLAIISLMFSRIPTSYKFLIVVVPRHKFSQITKFLDRTQAYAVLKIFAIRNIPSYGASIHYFCIHCPTHHKLVLRTTTKTSWHKILARLVIMEQNSVSVNAKSELLGRLFVPKSYSIFGRVEKSWTSKTVEEYLRKEYQMDKFDSSYFTRAKNALKIFTLPQLLDYILLEGAIWLNLSSINTDCSARQSYHIPRLGAITNFREADGNMFIILVGAIEFNFVTCDGIQPLLSYKIYISPLDGACWGLTVTFLIVIASIVGNLRRSFHAFWIIFIDLMGVLVEKSIQMSSLSRANVAILSLWIWSSLILTTGWKAVFTTEVITPIFPMSRFKSFPDLTNFTFYFPIEEEEFYFYENPGISYVVPYLVYILHTLRSSKAAGIANFSMQTLQADRDTGYTRIFPLAYNHPEHFFGNLTKWNCKKVAYADTCDRINAILSYAIHKGKKSGARFAKGKDVLRTNPKGWMWLSLGDSRRAENLIRRQQIFMSSGIYRYWEGLYGRFKRAKLFQDYDNDKMQENLKDKGLGTDSKIVSAMVILGMGCGICIMIFLIEVFCFVLLL